MRKTSGKARHVALVAGLAFAMVWPLTGLAQAIHPYVLVEFSKSENGTAEPMVVSPSGNVIVDASGKILDSRAGTVGAFTQTAGIQEGINFAIATGSDLYIEGRNAISHTNNNVYFVNAPVTVPAAQDFRIDGGEYVMNYDLSSGDLLTIDSCEDCHFRFGLMVAGSVDGNDVVFRPTHPTPIDGLVVITDSTFSFSSIATNQAAGTSASGLLLDASNGSILWNQIFATAVVGFQSDIRTVGPAGSEGVLFNKITVRHVHGATQELVSMEGAFSEGNTWLLGDNNDSGSAASYGIITSGTNNTFILQSSGFPSGHDIVFQPGATGNIVIGVGNISATDHNPPHSNRIILGVPRPGGDFDSPANSSGR